MRRLKIQMWCQRNTTFRFRQALNKDLTMPKLCLSSFQKRKFWILSGISRAIIKDVSDKMNYIWQSQIINKAIMEEIWMDPSTRQRPYINIIRLLLQFLAKLTQLRIWHYWVSLFSKKWKTPWKDRGIFDSLIGLPYFKRTLYIT